MKPTKISREGVWVFLLLTFSWGQVSLFHSALESQAVRSVQIISPMMEKLLEHTHRLNDDLTMQMAIQGFSQSSGVIFACVLDNDRKIIAHTEPTLLGHSFNTIFHRSPNQSLWIHTLKDASVPWGSFVIALSRRPLHQKVFLETCLLIVGDVALITSLLWIRMNWKKIYEHEFERAEKIDRQRSEMAEQVKDLIQKQKQTEQYSLTWIQSATEKIPNAVILLDSAQRVLAGNRLQGEHHAQSWQNIPELKEYGDALQRSIETPGEMIEIGNSGGNGTLQFLSQITPEGALIGTWVFMS